jgi:rhamnosyl/mannosyltransferase
VVPLGLDPDRVRHDVEHERLPPNPREHLDVLAIGRLAYYKGFRYLIEAVSKLDNVHVHIVGKGKKERDLKKLARRLNVSGWVTFYGQLSDSELAARFAACDCVCLPSIERTEAFGLVLLEAMYFSKATVVSDVPGSGMGWVVEHNVTGLKVPPANSDKLAEALQRLSQDRALSRTLGENGKAKFDRLFSIDESVINLVKVYNTLQVSATAAQS